MAARKWDVWSIDREKLRGLVVHEGITEKEATADADRRNATAARQRMPGVAFVALPQGRQPAESDLPPLPADAQAELGRRAGGPEPRRRYSTIGWGKLRSSDNPEDSDLCLAGDNGTTIICFTPADRALLAAVVASGEPVTAGEVASFLEGLTDAGGLSAAEEDAVRTVHEVLTRDRIAWES